jgi:hypothetical protein
LLTDVTLAWREADSDTLIVLTHSKNWAAMAKAIAAQES